jgi:hypothetical protein
MTALRNVTLGLTEVLRLPRDEADAIARKFLHKVRLEGKELAYPEELSGGPAATGGHCAQPSTQPQDNEVTAALFFALRRERAQGRIAAGAAAAYHQSGRIGIPLFNQVARAMDAVLDVDDTALPPEPKPICKSVPCTAPIVYVEHANARLVQYWIASESVLEAAAVGPSWILTSTGTFSPSGAVNSGKNGG